MSCLARSYISQSRVWINNSSQNMILLRTIISVIFFISVTKACIPCLNNILSSDGDFGIFFPRYLGNWVLSGDYDGNPFYTCPWDCHGLRSFLVSMLSYYFFHLQNNILAHQNEITIHLELNVVYKNQSKTTPQKPVFGYKNLFY